MVHGTTSFGTRTEVKNLIVRALRAGFTLTPTADRSTVIFFRHDLYDGKTTEVAIPWDQSLDDPIFDSMVSYLLREIEHAEAEIRSSR